MNRNWFRTKDDFSWSGEFTGDFLSHLSHLEFFERVESETKRPDNERLYQLVYLAKQHCTARQSISVSFSSCLFCRCATKSKSPRWQSQTPNALFIPFCLLCFQPIRGIEPVSMNSQSAWSVGGNPHNEEYSHFQGDWMLQKIYFVECMNCTRHSMKLYSKRADVFSIDGVPSSFISTFSCIPLCPLCCRVLQYESLTDSSKHVPVVADSSHRRMAALSGYMTRRVILLVSDDN